MADTGQTWVFDRCQPDFPAGENVTITVDQSLHSDQGMSLLTMTGPGAVKVVVEGPRLQLTPDDIAGVYPAPDSEDSSDEFLPHIALKRRTLPWERSLVAGGERGWLALLLLTESELGGTGAASPGPTLAHLTVGQVNQRDAETFARLKLLKLPDETPVHMVFVPAPILQKVLPRANEVGLLCHMKRTGADDIAIVVGNRLPDAPEGKQAELHTAFLVSLEGRGDLYSRNMNSGSVGLVVLHHWTFRPSKGGDFEQVMQTIAIRPNGGVLRFGNRPSSLRPGAEAPLSGGFPALLDDFGFPIVPLDHTQTTAGAVYRGPLRPFPTPDRNSKAFAVRAAPEEFAEAGGGTHDYSYAAAFEWGRILALNNSAIVDDMHDIRAVPRHLDLPLLVVDLPAVLLHPIQVSNPNPQDKVEVDARSAPWSMPSGESIVKSEQQLLDFAGRADPSGLAGLPGDLRQQVLEHLRVMAAPAPPATAPVDIGVVTAQELGARFADVKNASAS